MCADVNRRNVALETICDKGLKCSRSIGQSHGHNQEFEGAILGAKGCLPLMASGDTNIVVTSMQVKLCVDLGTAELVKEVGDKQDQVLILPGELIEVPKVDTEPKGAIFLLREQDWG